MIEERVVIMQVAGEKGNGKTSVIKYFDLAPGQTFKEPDTNGTNPDTKLNGTLGREVLSSDTYNIDNGNKDGYVYYLLGKVNGYVALYRLGLNNQGEFAVAHNKAYFKFKKDGTSAAKARFSMFVEDSETTGIRDIRQTVSAAANDKVKVYDMNGRFVGYSLDVLPHGLYIQNGKKVVR